MNRRVATSLLCASLLVSYAAPAAAHISLEQGGTHKSRYGDRAIKAGPCGRAGGTRSANIYTYEPGTTITVSVVEFISHPGYFRVAFDNDGDDGFKEPASIKPVDSKRKCPSGPTDHCGASDFYNSPEVLAGMDNLAPHLASLGTTPKYTWQVKLPDVECTNCTLQIIQVMEDDDSHGPYDPTPGVGVEDIYHQCIDLVLKRGASSDAGTSSGSPGTSSGNPGTSSGNPGTSSGNPGTSSGNPATSSGNPDGGAGPAAASDGGGCSTTRRSAGFTSLASLALALALCLSRRRRP